MSDEMSRSYLRESETAKYYSNSFSISAQKHKLDLKEKSFSTSLGSNESGFIPTKLIFVNFWIMSVL